MAKKALALKIVASIAVLGAGFWVYKKYFGGPPKGWNYANPGTSSAGWAGPGNTVFYYGQKAERPWANPGHYRPVQGHPGNFSLTGVGAT
jgi:hypothetical protein